MSTFTCIISTFGNHQLISSFHGVSNIFSFLIQKKTLLGCEHIKSLIFFKRNYDNTDFITIELFSIWCFTFFKIFLLSEFSLTPAIVLSVNLLLGALSFELSALNFGSCPRNPIISVSWDQSFCSCSRESDIQESFCRWGISWANSVIDR